MKWQVVGLVVLGLVAAVCASVLVGGARMKTTLGGTTPQKNPEIAILVADKDLEATQIIDADAIRVKTVRLDDAPKDYLKDPILAVGRVLIVPLLQEQAVTERCFAKDGSGLQLAAALPEGKRAMGIQLADDSGLAGVLYPGCLVDVLVAFAGRSADETRAKTLFQGVQVLSIEEKSIVNPEGSKSSRPTGANRKRVVTLLLDRTQAEQLQAVLKNGTIALTLRNPLDKTKTAEAAESKVEQVEPAAASPVWEMTILRAREQEMKKFERQARLVSGGGS